MAGQTSTPRDTPLRTAITVMNSGVEPMLCPFFGKCDGILIFDSESGSRQFRPSTARSPECVCELIVEARPHRLICGYIGEAEKRKLRALGIDVRLGACNCPLDELAATFCNLPEA